MHVYIYTVFIGFPYNLMHHFCSDLKTRGTFSCLRFKLPFQLRSSVWLNLLLARRSFTLCLQWQWNCSAMWEYALVASCKIDDSMPPRSSQHLQKPIKMDFLTSPIWTVGFEVELMTDFRAGFYSTLSQHHCYNSQDGHFANPAVVVASVMFMIVSVSYLQQISRFELIHPTYIYICQFVKQKMSHVFATHFLHLFQCLQFVLLRTDTIWLVFKEPLTISRAQRDLYRGVGEAQGVRWSTVGGDLSTGLIPVGLATKI